jgi:diguanylate cyclase (GGDEF)-like protein
MDSTVSIGVACVTGAAELQPLMVQADEALYRAKHTGRNRVAKAGDPQEIAMPMLAAA